MKDVREMFAKIMKSFRVHSFLFQNDADTFIRHTTMIMINNGRFSNYTYLHQIKYNIIWLHLPNIPGARFNTQKRLQLRECTPCTGVPACGRLYMMVNGDI